MVAAVADEEIAHECIAKKSYRLDKEYIEELIKDYYIGGIIFLGKSEIEKQKERTKHFQNIAKIPLLIGQDLEPGRVGKSRFDSFNYPSNQEIGVIDNQNYTFALAKEIGAFCASLGVHINFAPVADINSNPDNPIINDRSFGTTAEPVTYQCLAFMTGLNEKGIISCTKHFPGHGDTINDSHKTLPYLKHNRNRLDEVELFPFKKLIEYNIPAIMIGHIAIPALDDQNIPASLSKKIVTDLLRKEFGFNGLIITDALDMAAVTKDNGDAEVQALLAGNDILLCPMDVPKAIIKIKKALADDLITEKEIDAHVERILHVKNQIFI